MIVCHLHCIHCRTCTLQGWITIYRDARKREAGQSGTTILCTSGVRSTGICSDSGLCIVVNTSLAVADPEKMKGRFTNGASRILHTGASEALQVIFFFFQNHQNFLCINTNCAGEPSFIHTLILLVVHVNSQK